MPEGNLLPQALTFCGGCPRRAPWKGKR
jgi:hypothetical protein